MKQTGGGTTLRAIQIWPASSQGELEFLVVALPAPPPLHWSTPRTGGTQAGSAALARERSALQDPGRVSCVPCNTETPESFILLRLGESGAPSPQPLSSALWSGAAGT